MITKLDNDIVCFEAGSHQQPWSSLVDSVVDDLDALLQLQQRGVIDVSVEGVSILVSGTDRVGVILLPSGRKLVIKSKVKNLLILEWLAYLNEFPYLDDWLRESGISTGDDFHESIARLYLYQLEKLTRLHLRKDYTLIDVEDSTVRGRIKPHQLIKRLNKLPRIPQVQRVRSFDSTYNSVLALALSKMPLLLTNAQPEDRHRFAALKDFWEGIAKPLPDPSTAVTAAQWAAPPGYRTALQLARLILLGASLDSDSNYGGQAFVLPLALIWERSVFKMFSELSESTGWVPTAKEKRIRKWDDSAGKNDPSRWLNADVMLMKDKQRWILDAKYKRAFGNESRVDRFQMCAYAVAFDAERVSLVYPTSQGIAQHRVLLNTMVGSKPMLIDSINLPMSSGCDQCREALKTLVLKTNQI
ncbi:MAG: hypothetical protein GY818_02565 [Planctomycetaceae bacterium]|nr:hypothetical protein [Planctomycetaceae bacterium]